MTCRSALMLALACVACGSDPPGTTTSQATESTGDGDGDPGESGESMSTGDGDGDGDPGDGDGDPGDGDGDPGDGDGDGDGDPVDECGNPLDWPDPIFYSTLDDVASVTTPAAGSGDSASVDTTPADDFVFARCDDGVRIDGDDDAVRFRQMSGDGTTANFEWDQGTIDFWYSPFSPHDTNDDWILFHTADPTSDAQFRFRKAGDSNNHSIIIIDDGVTRTETTVQGPDYAWGAGDWVHLTIAWDTSVAVGEDLCWIYIDGVQMPTVQFGFDTPLSMPAEDPGVEFVVGLLPDMLAPSGLIADGVIDDFKIYDEVLTP